MDYYDLAEREAEEELIPELLPVDARLSLKTLAPILITLFERAASVTPTKELVPGTAYTLFEAFSAEATHVPYAQITATDGERSLVVVAEGVQVHMAGAVLLPPKRLLSILKLISEETVKLEVVGTECTIRAGRAQWTVQVPAETELPPLPDTSHLELVGVPKTSFMSALQAARRAAATTTARSALMQVRVKDGSITGCDGARVHKKVVEGLDTSLDFTLSLNTADELLKALRISYSDTFEVGSSPTETAFRIDQDILIGKRLNLSYPDVDSAMLYGPFMRNTDGVTVGAKDLAEAIRRVRVSADPDFAGIFLAIVPGKKDEEGTVPWNISVRARDKNKNSAHESVPCTWDGTKARELCINHHAMLDLLDVYGNGDITLKLGEDTNQRRSPVYVGTDEFQASVSQMSMLK